ncbi:MAG: hypothetical protein IJ979_00900, partial [Tidjanibacter sp.]|nr:hypothetical protein [Tidjanibacter sp.]
LTLPKLPKNNINIKRSCPLPPKPAKATIPTPPEAEPRDTSPAEAGAWGWVRPTIACGAGRCRGGE